MFKIRASRTTLNVLYGVAVALFLGCCFLYFNRAGKLDDMERELQQAQVELADSQAVVQRLDQAEADYRSAQGQLSVLESGVSSKAYVPTLLRQLEDLGRKNHLHVVGVRPNKSNVALAAAIPANNASNAANILPYDRLDVEIEVNGSYKDAVRFLRELTSFPKIIAVRDVQIFPLVADHSGQIAPLSIKFNTTAFIMKEEPENDNTEEASNPGSQTSRT